MSHHDMRNTRGGRGGRGGKKSDGLAGFDSFWGILKITMETWGDYQKYYFSGEGLRHGAVCQISRCTQITTVSVEHFNPTFTGCRTVVTTNKKILKLMTDNNTSISNTDFAEAISDNVGSD